MKKHANSCNIRWVLACLGSLDICKDYFNLANTCVFSDMKQHIFKAHRVVGQVQISCTMGCLVVKNDYLICSLMYSVFSPVRGILPQS